MSKNQATIPLVPSPRTQPPDHAQWLEQNAEAICIRKKAADERVRLAHQKLANDMRVAICILELELFKLETVGDLDDSAIEDTYGTWAGSFDRFREEKELAAIADGCVNDALQAIADFKQTLGARRCSR